MIIQIIRLKSNLEESELLSRAEKRLPQFKAIAGLLQKYYVKLAEPGQYGGLYVWESREALKEFQSSELAASIPAAYEIIEAPDVELLEVFSALRE